MALLNFPTLAYVAPALPSTISTEVTVEVVQQDAEAAVKGLGRRPSIAAAAGAAAIVVYQWFRSMQPPSKKLAGPAVKKEDSKKVMRVFDALKIVEEEYSSLSGVGFWIPGTFHDVLLSRIRAKLRAAALGQGGHTVRRRISQGKRGRPKNSDPPFVRQYLRI